MGAYINPKDMGKEEGLIKNGKRVETAAEAWDMAFPGYMPVVLVDNGNFTAAAIAYNHIEFVYFSRDTDIRPKIWYVVSIEMLHKVSPELKKYMDIK